MMTNKKEKLKELLQRVESVKPGIPSPLSFSLHLEGTDTIPNKEKDIKPLISMMGKIKKHFDAKNESMSSEMSDKFEDIRNFITETEEKLSASSQKESASLLKELRSVKEELGSTSADLENTKGISGIELKTLKEGLSSVEKEVTQIMSVLGDDLEKREMSQGSVTQELSTIKTKLTSLEKELESKLKETNKDFIDRVSRIESSIGGGSMNRQIKVGGVDVLKSYTDINLIGGTGVTITSTNDNTDKNRDITFTASGFSPSAPTSGTVNGTNTTFVFTSAPALICVDQGRFMQKVSSDGSVNWTGTTTVVLTVAPTFDIFAL